MMRSKIPHIFSSSSLSSSLTVSYTSSSKVLKILLGVLQSLKVHLLVHGSPSARQLQRPPSHPLGRVVQGPDASVWVLKFPPPSSNREIQGLMNYPATPVFAGVPSPSVTSRHRLLGKAAPT